MIDFVFETYPEDGPNMVAHFECLRDINVARRKAGQMAKRCNGPVDVAYDSNADWNERYITTVAPSEYHASGYCFKRLD